MRVLIIEDNHRLNQALQKGLVGEGYGVDAAFDGEDGQHFAEVTAYDAIILDVMLPKKDGLAVCQALRQQHINTPIVMLTARDAVDDRIKGLDSGADDYLVKPFAMGELLARLRALLRRDTANKAGLLQVGDLIVDPATHFVHRAGQPIELTTKEFAILEYFVRHPNQILTREMVEDHIWSYESMIASNVVDVYMRRLRRKIDEGFEVKLLETIRGSGYRLHLPIESIQAW